eukprot:992429-Pyramimonas_sp.AAC.1
MCIRDSGEARLHISQDKNPRQVKLEILGRKTKLALQGELGGRKVFFDRDRGWVSVGWDALCKIEPKQGREKAEL